MASTIALPDLTKIAPQTLLNHQQQLLCCRFSLDGEWLFAGGFDGRLYRWRLAGGAGAAGGAGGAGGAEAPGAKDGETAAEERRSESFAAHRGWMEAMRLAPDGRRLYTADSWGQIHGWPLVGMTAGTIMEPAWTVDHACGAWLRSIAVSNDGQLLASCGNEPVVRVYSTADGQLLHELHGHASPVWSVAFAPDGRRLASGDLQGVIHDWDLASGNSARRLDASILFAVHHQYRQGGVRAMAFDPQGDALYCGGLQGTNANQSQGAPTVLALDWDSGKQRRLWTPAEAFNGPVMDVICHPAGLVIASGSSEGGGRLWFFKPDENQEAHSLKHSTSFRKLDLAAAGDRLAAVAFGSVTGQRGGNGRQLDSDGNYVDFGGSIAIFGCPAAPE